MNYIITVYRTEYNHSRILKLLFTRYDVRDTYYILITDGDLHPICESQCNDIFKFNDAFDNSFYSI